MDNNNKKLSREARGLQRHAEWLEAHKQRRIEKYKQAVADLAAEGVSVTPWEENLPAVRSKRQIRSTRYTGRR